MSTMMSITKTARSFSKKGDGITWPQVLAAAVTILVLSFFAGWGVPALAKAGKTGQQLGECAGLGGVCMTVCTDENPKFPGSDVIQGCSANNVCCSKSQFNNIIVQYMQEGMPKFKPVAFNKTTVVSFDSLVRLSFFVKDQKDAAYCQFSYKMNKDAVWHTFSANSATGLSPLPDFGTISAPEGQPYAEGACPDAQADYEFRLANGKGQGGYYPVTLRVDVYSYKPSADTLPRASWWGTLSLT